MIQSELFLSESDYAIVHSLYSNKELWQSLANVLMVMEQESLNAMISAVSNERFHDAAKWAGYGAALTAVPDRLAHLSEVYIQKRKELLGDPQ